MNKLFEALIDVSKTYEEGNKRFVEGLAATSDLDLQDEIISSGALDGAEGDLIDSSLLWNHEGDSRPIGKIIEAKSIKDGLWIKALISQTAGDVWEQIIDGSISKFSVRGKILKSVVRFIKGLGKNVRIIEAIQLIEASLVALPANPKAKVIAWYVRKSLGPITQEAPSSSTVEAPGGDLNQAVADTRKELRQARQAHEKPDITNYTRRLVRNNEDARNQALLDNAEILPEITCSLKQAARFCAASESQMIEALKSIPSLSGAQRQGHSNELWSSAIYASRAEIQRAFSIIAARKHINKRFDKSVINLSKEEIRAFANIRSVRGASCGYRR